MKEGQEAIYYIAAEDEAAATASPQLEGFRKKGVEVLYLTDPIDEFWVQTLYDGFEGKPLKSITRGGADLKSIQSGEAETAAEEAKPDAANPGAVASLGASGKLAAGDPVTDVRTTAPPPDRPAPPDRNT